MNILLTESGPAAAWAAQLQAWSHRPTLLAALPDVLLADLAQSHDVLIIDTAAVNAGTALQPLAAAAVEAGLALVVVDEGERPADFQPAAALWLTKPVASCQWQALLSLL